MSLLDKFASVEIKADNRISDADRAFCARQQEAFDKSGPALQAIAELMASQLEEQKNILAAYEEFTDKYMVCEGFGCKPDSVYKAMQVRNGTFISTIVSYFARTYAVKLDAQIVKKHLIPEEPSFDRRTEQLLYGGWKNMTEEQQDEYKRKLQEHEQQKDEYEDKLRHLSLRYEQIVDEIFVQLGGFSFHEQAMNEFLQRTWKCCHNSWNGEEQFEIKNNTLRLTGSWCYCDDRWSWGPEWKPGDSLKTLLDALAWYECGRMNEGARWFPDLFHYDVKENEFSIHNMEKVKHIKMFKNGRVGIKFRSAAYVQEFVEKCMRVKITEGAA